MSHSAVGRTAPARKPDGGMVPLRIVALMVGAAVVGIAIPQFVGSMLFLSLLTQAVIGATLATGVGFLIRQNAAVSFGHAAYFGLAVYSIGLLLRFEIASVEFALLFALIVPTLLALLLGLVIVRIPGVAFAMLTLAIGQAFHELAIKGQALTNGEDGFAIDLPRHLFGLSVRTFQSPSSMFLVCWFVFAAVLFGLYFLTRSPFGRLTSAIRENEERARFIGYETLLPRALIYAVSAFIAALAGILSALYNGFVSPGVLHWSLSGTALIMAVIGGPKLIWGPAFGAIIFFFLKDMAGNVTEHWLAVIGTIVIVVTVMMPTGIGGTINDAVVKFLKKGKTA